MKSANVFRKKLRPGHLLSMIALLLGTTLGLSRAHATDKQILLYNFNRGTGGYAPAGNLLIDASGNLVGAANQGGSSNSCGTIFEVSPKAGGGWTYSVLYTFTGLGNDCFPLGSLVRDGQGNLFGTATSFRAGEVFEVSPDGQSGWTETVLHEMSSSEGVGPTPLVMDGAGNLYGAQQDGGATNNGFVFEVSPDGSGGWTFQDIYDFHGQDGNHPVAALTLDAAGNLYGTTLLGGGSTACANGCGVVFKLTNNAGTWTETVIHKFNGSNGGNPGGPVTFDANGNLFGSAMAGGPLGFGIIFELLPVTTGWQAKTIHSFFGQNGDGAAPNSPLTFFGGSLYGTTLAGGGGLGECVAAGEPGCGSVFSLTPFGNSWKETILFDFDGGTDGAFPAGVVLDSKGRIFGVAEAGGSSNAGVVYELVPTN